MFISGIIVVFVGILSTGEIILKNKVICLIAKIDHQDSIFDVTHMVFRFFFKMLCRRGYFQQGDKLHRR